MSIIKLAVYGGIGYLVYQTFFANMPASQAAGRQDRSQEEGGSLDRSGMTGGGHGRMEETAEPTGTSARHRVGRGVI